MSHSASLGCQWLQYLTPSLDAKIKKSSLMTKHRVKFNYILADF